MGAVPVPGIEAEMSELSILVALEKFMRMIEELMRQNNELSAQLEEKIAELAALKRALNEHSHPYRRSSNADTA